MVGLRNLLAPALSIAHRLRRRRMPPGAVRILILHDIKPAQEASLQRLLERIAIRHGFVAPAEAVARLGGRAPADGRAPVLVSFDDGFRSNLGIAEGMLARLGIKALFFVCPGLIDTAPAEQPAAVARRMFRGATSVFDLPAPPVLMAWEDLARLVEQGHEIGAHSLTHRALEPLRGDSLLAEVVDSGERIADRLGRPVPWFAFPFGDIASIGQTALDLIAAHYPLCRSGVRGLATAATPPLALPAQHVDLDAPPAWQDFALEGGLDFRYGAAFAELCAMAATATEHAGGRNGLIP